MKGFGSAGRRWKAALLALAAVVPALTGCDDAVPVDADEQLLRVGGVTLSVCPDQDATNQEGTTTILATVFARDGVVVPDIPVNFTADFAQATLDPARTPTSTTGRASTTLTSVRPPNDRITVIATLDTGQTDDHVVRFPVTPLFLVEPVSLYPLVGQTVQLDVGVGQACNITELRAEIAYNADVLEYQPGEEIELNALNDVTEDGTPTGTTLQVDSSVAGRISFRYARDDGRGVSVNAGYLRFIFTALAEGDANIEVVAPSATLIASVGPPYNLYPEGEDPRVGVISFSVYPQP